MQFAAGVGRRDASEQQRDRLLDQAALAVVRRHAVVAAALQEHVVRKGRIRSGIDGDRRAASFARHLHAGYVGEAVADIDHIGEGHAAFVFGRKAVQVPVVRHIEDALVDPEQVLGFFGIIDRGRRPHGKAVVAVDKARGEYTFVWEKAPLFTRYDVDSKFVLDGFGEGEYHKEGNVHKIKYTFNDPNIEISDKLTGIKYQGTVIDGELELYDGSPDSSMVSHFLFKKKKPY